MLSLIMLLNFSSLAQEYKVQILDEQSNQPISYAHISSEGKLATITDHFGRANIPRSAGMSYQVTCIGYRPLHFTDQLLSENHTTTIKLNPDEKILDTVTITPTTLEDMISEVYENIPKAYLSKPHLLRGELIEKYMDTLGHVHINSAAQLQVQKAPYSKQHNKGEVKLDSLSRVYDVTKPLYTQIYAGAHIPHRFDFVMKREEFINPSSFSKYNYDYQGEYEIQNRLVDVIGFEPNSSSLIEGQFAGKIYLDMKEKVFLKAEYHYTKTGIFSNPESRWVDRRQFITEYKLTEQGWCFAYTWDEAVRKSDNFLLSQYFKTSSVGYDTAIDWAYEEKTHFHDIVETEPADTMIVINEIPMRDSIPQVQFTRTSTGLYKIKSKLETALGFRMYSLNEGEIAATGDVAYQSETLRINESFSLASVDIGLFWNLKYRVAKSIYAQFNQSESFSKRVRKGNWDLGLIYRIRKQQGRPADFNLSLGYAEFTSRFRFEKQEGVEPYYLQRHRGLTTGLSYEIRLNGLFKLGFGYNYFLPISSTEKFYLKEKYGIFNFFSKKHEYSTDLISWEMDGEDQADPLNIFNNHSFDLSLIIGLE